jgi:hypothetical protein
MFNFLDILTKNFHIFSIFEVLIFKTRAQKNKNKIDSKNNFKDKFQKKYKNIYLYF